MGVSPADYCREIEAYLTRKNDGHLIRIVGPAFDRVCDWAVQGVPLKVAFRGIDRYVERYYAKGPRRRPVRIEHCEDDVLEGFDHWRRAVGVGMAGAEASEAPAKRHESLATSLARVVARLTTLRADRSSGMPEAILEKAVGDIDAMAASAGTARGASRELIVASLERIDGELMTAARESLSPDVLDDLRRQAIEDLGPFRDRMATDAWTRARDAAVSRAIRERVGLPILKAD